MPPRSHSALRWPRGNDRGTRTRGLDRARVRSARRGSCRAPAPREPSARRRSSTTYLEHPKLSGKSIRFVATTLQGFGGTPRSATTSAWRADARLAGKLAADFGCDAVVGQQPRRATSRSRWWPRVSSPGRWPCSHPPSHARTSSRSCAMLDRHRAGAGRRASGVGGDVEDDRQRGERRLSRRAPRSARRGDEEERPRCSAAGRSGATSSTSDRHGSLVPRLCDSGVKAWVVVRRARRRRAHGRRAARRSSECPRRDAWSWIPDARALHRSTRQPGRHRRG